MKLTSFTSSLSFHIHAHVYMYYVIDKTFGRIADQKTCTLVIINNG